jgi:hypothetical protein
MTSFLTLRPVAARLALFAVFCGLIIWPGRNQAQPSDQARIDKAVQVVKELCLAGTQYDLHVDAKGNIIIKKLLPGTEGSVTVSAREAKGATAVYDQKLRIIADAEVRDCTRTHIPRIIDAILSYPQNLPSPPSSPRNALVFSKA